MYGDHKTPALQASYAILKKYVLPMETKFSKATTISTTKQLINKTSQETEEILTQETVKQARHGESSRMERQSRNELWDTKRNYVILVHWNHESLFPEEWRLRPSVSYI